MSPLETRVTMKIMMMVVTREGSCTASTLDVWPYNQQFRANHTRQCFCASCH
jgi:hypothetical protein